MLKLSMRGIIKASGIFLIFLGGFVLGQISKSPRIIQPSPTPITSPTASPSTSPDIFFKVTGENERIIRINKYE